MCVCVRVCFNQIKYKKFYIFDFLNIKFICMCLCVCF